MRVVQPRPGRALEGVEGTGDARELAVGRHLFDLGRQLVAVIEGVAAVEGDAAVDAVEAAVGIEDPHPCPRRLAHDGDDLPGARDRSACPRGRAGAGCGDDQHAERGDGSAMHELPPHQGVFGQ